MTQAQRSAQRHYNGKNMKSSKMQCGGLSGVNKGAHSQLFLTPEGCLGSKEVTPNQTFHQPYKTAPSPPLLARRFLGREDLHLIFHAGNAQAPDKQGSCESNSRNMGIRQGQATGGMRWVRDGK